MNYRALRTRWLRLEANSETELDSKNGLILIPPIDSKVFLHWINANGKLVATYTMTTPTQIRNRVKVINPADHKIGIQVIEI